MDIHLKVWQCNYSKLPLDHRICQVWIGFGMGWFNLAYITEFVLNYRMRFSFTKSRWGSVFPSRNTNGKRRIPATTQLISNSCSKDKAKTRWRCRCDEDHHNSAHHSHSFVGWKVSLHATKLKEAIFFKYLFDIQTFSMTGI